MRIRSGHPQRAAGNPQGFVRANGTARRRNTSDSTEATSSRKICTGMRRPIPACAPNFQSGYPAGEGVIECGKQGEQASRLCRDWSAPRSQGHPQAENQRDSASRKGRDGCLVQGAQTKRSEASPMLPDQHCDRTSPLLDSHPAGEEREKIFDGCRRWWQLSSP